MTTLLEGMSVVEASPAASPETAGAPAVDVAVPTPAATPTPFNAGISPKLSAAALGGAFATLVGIGVAHFLPAITAGELSALVGAVGTLLTFAIGYYMPDPLRHAGSAVVATVG